MKFDIKAHLQDHAYYFKQYKKVNKDDLHFKFSILDLYFHANNYQIEEKLEEILEELLKKTQYTIKMKNGFYTDKNGNKKQKYANRNITIDLKPVLKAVAIHTQGSKREYTQPHFHFLIAKNARLGLNYSLLKHHISKTLEKYKLIAHFDELNDYKYKNLAKSVSKFFWQLKKLDNAKFKKYILNNEHVLKKYLDLLYEYAKDSNRIDYFFKTMKELNERLNRLKIDFKYKNFNLKTSYQIDFILENKDNKEVIKLLNEKNYTQKELSKYINNPILKDAIRYCINKQNSYIVNEIKKHTTILNNFKSNKTLVNNYLKLLNKDLKVKKTKTQLKKENKLEYIKAFKNALKTAKNEKELREILNKKYDFKFKKKKGKTIGFSFDNTYLSIKDLNFNDIKEIRAILIKNNTPNNNTNNTTITYKKVENENKLQKLSIRIGTKISEANRIEREVIETEQAINEADTTINGTKQQIKRVQQHTDEAKYTIDRAEQTITSRIRAVREKISSSIKRIRDEASRIGRRLISTLRRRNSRKNSNNSMSR